MKLSLAKEDFFVNMPIHLEFIDISSNIRVRLVAFGDPTCSTYFEFITLSKYY